MSNKDAILNLVLEALQTDGAHHKQYYLEEILKLLTNSDEWLSITSHLAWQEGIAP
jgi:hypothetical protein